MTQSDAVAAAQRRANKTGKRMFVYYVVREGREWNGYHVTPDLDNIPHDRAVIAVIRPREIS